MIMAPTVSESITIVHISPVYGVLNECVCVLEHNQNFLSISQVPVCPGCCPCQDPHGWRLCSLMLLGRQSLEAQGAGPACCTSWQATTLCCSSQSLEMGGTMVRTSELAGEFCPITSNKYGKVRALNGGE